MSSGSSSRSSSRSLARAFGAVALLGGALGASALVAACGDLTIPATADGGNGDGGGSSDDGGNTVDGPQFEGGAPVDCNADGEAGHPTHLACTGLYSDWANRTVSPDVHAFDPGLHLWSDGAEKYRWIYLPPGQKIATTDLNEWKFPVGTKVWKEFRLLGKRVETRFLWKLAPQTWFRTTYQWTDSESDATELVGGAVNVRGIGYEIPSTDVCMSCHGGREDMLLGFEVVSLSTPQSTGLNMDKLLAMQLLTNPPKAKPSIPGDMATVASLGFLHSNCGTACHNNSPSSFAGATGMWLRLEVDANGVLPGDWKQTNTYKTAVNVVSNFTPVGQPVGSFMRIKPGDAEHSAIPYRDGRRDGVVQMPPIASHLVDFADVKTETDWINAMTPGGSGGGNDAGVSDAATD